MYGHLFKILILIFWILFLIPSVANATVTAIMKHDDDDDGGGNHQPVVQEPEKITLKISQIKEHQCFERKSMDECHHNFNNGSLFECMWCEYWCLHKYRLNESNECENESCLLGKLNEPEILDIVPKIIFFDTSTLVEIQGKHLDLNESSLIYNKITRIRFNNRYECDIFKQNFNSIHCILEKIDDDNQTDKIVDLQMNYTTNVYGSKSKNQKIVNNLLLHVKHFDVVDLGESDKFLEELKLEHRFMFGVIVCLLFCSVCWITYDKREFFIQKYELIKIFFYLNRTKKMLIARKLYMDFDTITYKNKLGDGNFGEVYAATIIQKDGSKINVAIKKLKIGINYYKLKMFITEGIKMSSFSHDRILTPLAIFMNKSDHLPEIVLPLMVNGDLCRHLRQRKMFPIIDLLKFSVQVAQGMEYLSKNNFIHGDLSARNCLLDDDFLIKIADFGLSRQLYTPDYVLLDGSYRPIRWMAIECLMMKRPKFTKKSDIWSFGVLLWEIFTLGSYPYENIHDKDILNHLYDGNRLEQPISCPEIVYKIMLKCWQEDWTLRPSFQTLREELEQISMLTIQSIQNEQSSNGSSQQEENQLENVYEQIVYNKCIDYTSLSNRYIQSSKTDETDSNQFNNGYDL